MKAGTRSTGQALTPKALGGGSGVAAPSEKLKHEAHTLLEESAVAVARFKEAKSINDVPYESVGSLAQRLQKQTRALGKRSDNAEGLDMLDKLNRSKKKLNPLFELGKVQQTFAKSKKKANARKVLEKWDDVIEGGFAVSDVALCFNARVGLAQAWHVLSDSKHTEADYNM